MSTAAKPKRSVSFSNKGKRKLEDAIPETKSKAKSSTTAEKPSKKSRNDEETTTPTTTTKSKGQTKANGVTSPSKNHKDSQKTKNLAKKPEPVAEQEVDEEEEAALEDEEEEEEEEIRLEGFSSESDSSDEDLDIDEPLPLDVGKLPMFAKDDVSVKRRLDKAKKNSTEERGVIYLGRIPHGFYEDQMRAYFSQFGDVTRLRLSRNKKTGRSKHYAFIEFSSAEVAQIVSDTMNNYLMMGHILQCRIIPKEQVHPELWVGANRKWRVVPRDRLAREKQNMPRTKEQQQRAESRLLSRQKQKQVKIAASGIDYDMSDVAYKAQA